MIEYISKCKSKVSENERKQLSFLHYSDGLCWKKFKNNDGFVILAKIEKNIIGWSFVYKNKDKDDKEKYVFCVYIHSSFRRRGIGTKIYKICENKYGKGNLYVSKYNSRATKFYRSVGA